MTAPEAGRNEIRLGSSIQMRTSPAHKHEASLFETFETLIEFLSSSSSTLSATPRLIIHPQGVRGVQGVGHADGERVEEPGVDLAHVLDRHFALPSGGTRARQAPSSATAAVTGA